jgi:hypothetical protein
MRKIVCIALALCSLAGSYAQVDSSFHLYLLVGQSNMAGRGEISPTYRDLQYDNIFMLNKPGDWVPARHPLHFDKPAIVGVGPGLAFAKTILDATGTRASSTGSGIIRIGLVPCAVGGTSINSWVPGGFDSATRTNPLDDALIRINTAKKSGVFKGIIWHQGESDSKPAPAARYMEDLKTLVNRLRVATGIDDLPFIAGELGTFRPNYNLINIELQKLTGTVRRSALAASTGLTHKGDTTHFNSVSADMLGKRMADKMIDLQQSPPNN